MASSRCASIARSRARSYGRLKTECATCSEPAARASGILRLSSYRIQSISFVIFGVAVFGPFNDNAQLIATGYGVLALLYMRGPLQSLIFDSGAFADASVALQRINELGVKLSEEIERPIQQLTRQAPGTNMLPVSPNWKNLVLVT